MITICQASSHVQAPHSLACHVSLFVRRSFSQQNWKEKTAPMEKDEEDRENPAPAPVPLMALNHVSRLCSDVKKSIEFYTNVLGFVLIERPAALDFEGAWLFNYGVGIHLVQCKDEDRLPPTTDQLDPMDNHISFQCEDMNGLEQRLKRMNVKYKKRRVEEEKGRGIEQLFFKDPDGFMVEICNCENIEVVPAESPQKLRLPEGRHIPPIAHP